MNHWLPAVIVGSTVALLGLFMISRNVKSWKRQQQDQELDDFDRTHYRSRFERRVQLSGIVVVVGILLAVGDVFIWGFGPLAATIYWIAVILLCCWMCLLALGDLAAVRSHSQVALRNYEAKRRALESELAKFRHRSNGKPS